MAVPPRKLIPLLKGWLKAGLITQNQSDAILKYEEAHSRHFNPMAWLAAAGGICLALGLILLVSHNWEELDARLKQAGFISLLGITALAASRFEDKPWIGPGLMMVWLGLPLAGIGLWGQIYQLSGDPLKPLLIWLVLTVPLAWLAWHPAPTLLHTVGLVCAAYVGAFSDGSWLILTERGILRWWGDSGHHLDLFRWGLNFLGVMLLWGAAAAQAHFRLQTGLRVALLFAAAAFMAVLGFTRSPLQCSDHWMEMLLVTGLSVVLWFACRAWGLRGTRLRGLGFGLSAFLTYGLSFTRHVRDPADFHWGGAAWALFWAISGISLVLLGHWKKMQLSRPWIGPLTALLPMALVVLGILGLPGWGVGVLANFCLAALCVVWMFESAVQGERALLDRATFLLGLLIFTRFVDYFGSLLRSGLGFIVAGLAFLALAYALKRGRLALLQGLGKEAKP